MRTAAIAIRRNLRKILVESQCRELPPLSKSATLCRSLSLTSLAIKSLVSGLCE